MNVGEWPTKMHDKRMLNGNVVSVSDMFDDAVLIKLTHNAGTAEVTTKIVTSVKAAQLLGRLLVQHHDREREERDLAALVKKCKEEAYEEGKRAGRDEAIIELSDSTKKKPRR